MRERPAVWAHRGACRDARENTLAAFELAREQGADGVELDVRRLRDGTLVVHHDATLAGGVPLAGLDRAEVPAWVPTLGEALDTCLGLTVNVELKNHPGDADFDPASELVPAAVAELTARTADDVIVSCFHPGSLDRVRAAAAELPTGQLVLGAPVEAVAAARLAGHRAIHPHVTGVDAAFVESAHAAGLAVNVWTVDDPDDLRRLAAFGVDAVITNLPALALDVLS